MMAEFVVDVEAPARLHFGMFSFGQPDARRFGGVGVMARQPALRLKISPDEQFRVSGPLAHRARHFARLAWRHMQAAADPPCHIQIQTAPSAHAGLGSGTQLAMALAAGLNSFCGRENVAAEELAHRVSRGARSAVGLHGFGLGGMIAESGKIADGEISPLLARATVPSRWRFVLVTPRDQQGIHGEAEHLAFSELPSVPTETTAELVREALLRLLPAVSSGRFDDASRSMYRYGHLAGMCFAARQGGAFASQRLRRLVEIIRGLGVTGVGQSSWGPTLYALTPDEAFAQRLVQRLLKQEEARDASTVITAATNRGAKIRVRQIA